MMQNKPDRNNSKNSAVILFLVIFLGSGFIIPLVAFSRIAVFSVVIFISLTVFLLIFGVNMVKRSMINRDNMALKPKEEDPFDKPISQPLLCAFCGETIEKTDLYCNNCGHQNIFANKN
ncbi:MAG: hypothetical protein RBQ91_03875 [Acholeplasma sp.]|nr:hypothetical protein [Acholeplasma sp.]